MENSNEKFLVMTDNLFTFNSYACHSVIDVINIRPGEVNRTLKMQGLSDEPIRFAFAPDKGLVRLSNNGAINSERILTQLISLPENNTEKILDFFKEYGFLFPLNTDNYEAIDINILFEIINRVKAVVYLMSEVESSKKDYKKILQWVLFLQLTPPSEFSLQCFKAPYITCIHPLYEIIENTSSILEIDGTREAYNSDFYSIADTVYKPIYQLNIEFYKDTISGYNTQTPGATHSQLYKNITRLYRNANNLLDNQRLMIDFIFHYQTRVGIIKTISAEQGIKYYDTDENIRKNYNLYFDDKLKNALLEIAKITIAEELNYNLQGVYPHYDIENMTPSWGISDLLSGIYFSIFYMKPGLELYRKCANPNCDRWFLVKTTASNRKYCPGGFCANSVAQRNHRKRQKEKSRM
ncbi:CGNR zinc finger domain-containing protein [Bacillus sp. APMAM]|nr:CGNR zinc finger domain-containing protein [Bacillus sp. APMAM]RTZ55594.1 CGNR zinc finger domain-containing protein [Bacillus sp. SAJ1]